jgi:hypothetical protein
MRFALDLDYGNDSAVLDEQIRFYYPGDYVLRVVDQLPGSTVNFTGMGRVPVAGESLRALEDLEDRVIGSLVTAFSLSLMVLLLLLSLNTVWKQLGFAFLKRDLAESWNGFKKSWYGTVLFILWMLVLFDIITTVVFLHYGGREYTDLARQDMFGHLWRTYIFFLGLTFLAYSWREKIAWKNVTAGLCLMIATGLYFGLLRAWAVVHNLSHMSELAGRDVFWSTLTVIALLSVALSLVVLRKLIKAAGWSRVESG